MLRKFIILFFTSTILSEIVLDGKTKVHTLFTTNHGYSPNYVKPNEVDLNRIINEMALHEQQPITIQKLPVIQTSYQPFQQYTTEEKKCPGGTCTPYYQCNNTNGEGIIDVRISDGEDCNYMEICCPQDDTSKFEHIPNHHVHSKIECGIRNTHGVGYRITNKNCQSQFGEFPWMIAVFKAEVTVERSLEFSYLCGGALIHPQVILTSAHCVNGKDMNQLKIRAGEWNTKSNNKIWPHQDRDVSEIVIHENYDKDSLQNDVAILFLNQPVNLDENIATLCLPPQNFAFFQSKCVASGWRKHIFGRSGNDEPILKKIELPIVSRQSCVQSLKETLLGNKFNLHDSFICAGGENRKDTYEGDGGSILVCPIPEAVNRYYHTGIIAWKIDGGENQVPDVYVNVALFKNWIDFLFVSRGLNSSFYTYTP